MKEQSLGNIVDAVQHPSLHMRLCIVVMKDDAPNSGRFFPNYFSTSLFVRSRLPN